MHRHIAFVALLAAASPAQAGELIPYGAESIQLGSIRGVAYYVEEPDSYRVVTTLADGESGLPIRFEATLAGSQRLTISVPGKIGELGQAIEIARAGNRLVISNPRAAANQVVFIDPQAR
jgi:hypothetical protein